MRGDARVRSLATRERARARAEAGGARGADAPGWTWRATGPGARRRRVCAARRRVKHRRRGARVLVRSRRSDQPVVASDQRAHPGWSSTCDDFSPPVLLSLRARAPSRLALHARGARCGRGADRRRSRCPRPRAHPGASRRPRDARRDLGPLPRRDRSRGSAPIAPGAAPPRPRSRASLRDRARLAPAAAAFRASRVAVAVPASRRVDARRPTRPGAASGRRAPARRTTTPSTRAPRRTTDRGRALRCDPAAAAAAAGGGSGRRLRRRRRRRR